MYQWIVCADGLWRPLCESCDKQLNRLVLAWMGDPQARSKFEDYAGLAAPAG